MKRWKWSLATVALTIGITGGAFAENQHWGDRRDNDHAVYSQRYDHDRDYAWNNNYRDRDRDGGYRQMQNRDHRDRDRGRDQDDRGRESNLLQ